MAYKTVNGKLVKVTSKGQHLANKSMNRALSDSIDSLNNLTNEFEPEQNKPDKGLKNGSCNRTACQRPGAVYFNKSTRAYYCKDCAREINWEGGRADCMALYGVPLLCELDKPEGNRL